ncbi:MAG: endolytic transglycosylase MltG, partial [Chloroflexota bacterium]|nr:endolytic transglycosylase MltG [Chloroflexota bacterium]
SSRSSRTAIIAVLLLGVIIFGVVYYIWNTATAIFQPPGAGAIRTIALTVSRGETTAQIGDDLQSKGLIRNSLAFRIWARIQGLDTRLQAGVYNHLNTSMTISDITAQLLNAQPDEYLVQIIEGWRIEQIANQLANSNLVNFKKSAFLTYTKHPDQFPDFNKYPILKSIPHGSGMEGLLFPSTYKVDVNADARTVVNQLLTTFQNSVSQKNLVAQAQAHHLSEYQMVIMASLLQREVRHLKDAPGVSSVFWNRIYKQTGNDTGGFLGSDPTVQYARDTLKPPVKYWGPLNDIGRNIAPNSLWNTYTNQGLPPTPICSPGLVMLEAAANPANTDNFYFLNTDNGNTYYARTNAQFEQLKNQYLH